VAEQVDITGPRDRLDPAYFSPGQDRGDALADAARRGVDVQLVLPSASDFPPVLHAGRSDYQSCWMPACASTNCRTRCCTRKPR
jgi:phosphatidylserine/phosphatidylglycerophosphate/cardiolipin synthase-like enzyme